MDEFLTQIDTDARRFLRGEIGQRILAELTAARIVVASQTVTVVPLQGAMGNPGGSTP